MRMVDAARIARPRCRPTGRAARRSSVEQAEEGRNLCGIKTVQAPAAGQRTAMATDISATMPTAEFISTPRESM